MDVILPVPMYKYCDLSNPKIGLIKIKKIELMELDLMHLIEAAGDKILDSTNRVALCANFYGSYLD